MIFEVRFEGRNWPPAGKSARWMDVPGRNNKQNSPDAGAGLLFLLLLEGV